MLSDFHLHTAFSGDSKTPPRDQIEAALSLGMTELCFTDHHDFDVDSEDIDFCLDFDAYFKELIPLKEEYQDRIACSIGIELGLQPHLGGYCRQLTAKYPFDFVIGSTHYISGKDPYYPSFFHGREEHTVYTEYFKILLENIRIFQDYDVVGHMDYIVRYGPNKNQYYNYEAYRDSLDSILETVLHNGKGIECNTGGYGRGLGHPNPHPDILMRYRKMGGEIITIGSDAHTAHELGANFKSAQQLLKDCGFHYYTTFENRKPIFHKL